MQLLPVKQSSAGSGAQGHGGQAAAGIRGMRTLSCRLSDFAGGTIGPDAAQARHTVAHRVLSSSGSPVRPYSTLTLG
ncbi:hypothetical protein ADK74_02360 [Streptomyces decoyicus]|nr:hypothetical protein ADK74_02360 [Streptomyces decoyicus]